jgi:hypothetical protein
MPLLDHFHPPLNHRRHWESFHSAWATKLADALNERCLPEGYFAEENTHAGARVAIDVATYHESLMNSPATEAATATLPPRVWSPPAPEVTLPAVFPQDFEVQVYATEGGYALVAAIELVSPANKDRPQTRRAFAAKCASLLYRGVGLIVMDIVTSRHENLHNEIMQVMDAGPSGAMAANTLLYAVGYQPIRRDEREQIDLWPRTLALGEPLPQLPLALGAEIVVPVDFEEAYVDVCRRRGWTSDGG